MNNDKDIKLGLFFGLFAFSFWGLIPIYFKAVDNVPAYEVLLHRVVWSIVVLFVVLLYKQDFHKVKSSIKNRKISIYLFASSLTIGFNWLTFIWAVEHNQILKTSLGYYINPLVTIFFGFIFLKEIPTPKQKIAIFLAFIAVCYQIYTIGSFPLVSLILAITFPLYGLLRKKIAVDSFVGLFIETLFLFPIALLVWFYLIIAGANHFTFSESFNMPFLLMLSGIVTVLPLLAFNSAAIRLKLSTIGYLQYLGPSVSLLLAVFVYNEPLSYEKIITFLLIWIALFVVSIDSYQRRSKK